MLDTTTTDWEYGCGATHSQTPGTPFSEYILYSLIFGTHSKIDFLCIYLFIGLQTEEDTALTMQEQYFEEVWNELARRELIRQPERSSNELNYIFRFFISEKSNQDLRDIKPNGPTELS